MGRNQIGGSQIKEADCENHILNAACGMLIEVRSKGLIDDDGE
jgi:hypothetical protein